MSDERFREGKLVLDKKFKILLVEDNSHFRRVMKDLLNSRFPYLTVGEAGNSQEAWEMITAWRPDLILMDISLPGKNGLELTRDVLGLHPGLPVIILTNYDLPEYRQASVQCGARCFFVKGSTTMGEIVYLVQEIVSESGFSASSGGSVDGHSPFPPPDPGLRDPRGAK